MKIPIITATEQLPTSIPVTVRPEFAGMVPRALGEVGQEIQGLAFHVAKEDSNLRARLKEADDILKINDAVNEFSLWHQKTSQDMNEQNIPPLKRQEVYATAAIAKRNELLNSFPKEDTFTYTRVQLALDKNVATTQLTEGQIGYKKEIEHLDAGFTQQALDAAYRGDFKKVNEIGNTAIAKGVWDENKRNKIVNDTIEIGEKSTIARMLGSENIAILKALKTKAEAGEYTKLNPLEKSTIIVQADKEIARLEDKEKREEDKKAVDVAYAKLKVFGENYESMFKMLRNPEWVAANNLGEGRKSALETMLHNEMNLKELEQKRIYEDTARELFPNLGTTKPETIDALVTTKKLTWQVGEHFKNAIINPPDIKTDPAEYVSILKDLAMERDKKEITQRILSSNKLSREDKKGLGNELYRDEARENKDWITRSRSFLESQIIPKFGIMEKIVRTPREEAAYYNAIKALDEKLEVAKKSGKPVEGRAILDLAAEIVPVYQRPIADAIIERQREMVATGGKIRAGFEKEKELKKTAGKYKTAEEVQNDYHAGKLSYEDAAAILAMKFGVSNANR